jgi:hypothetical protein
MQKSDWAECLFTAVVKANVDEYCIGSEGDVFSFHVYTFQAQPPTTPNTLP